MDGLTRTLKQLGWPYRAKVEYIGHIVTDSLLAGAFRFLVPEAREPS